LAVEILSTGQSRAIAYVLDLFGKIKDVRVDLREEGTQRREKGHQASHRYFEQQEIDL